MEAILRTNDYNEQFEIVEVVKNPISETNRLAHIINSKGIEQCTGGILIKNDPLTISVLEKLTPLEQWNWLCGLRHDFYVR